MEPIEIKQKIIIPSLDKARHFIPKYYYENSFDQVVFYGGPGAILDSLNLVSLVFLLEEEVKIKFGVEIKITTEDVLDTEKPPFLNIETLSIFINSKLTND